MTNTASKEYWLEKVIWDLINTVTQSKQDALSWVKDSQNRSKVIAAAVVLGGGSYGLVKLYSYLNKKPKQGKQNEQQKKPKSGISLEFFKRLWYLVGIAMPKYRSKEMISALVLALTVFSKSLLSNYLNSVSGDMMRDMIMQNKDSFFKLLAYTTALNLVLSTISPLLNF